MPMPPQFLSCDWGTSSFRIRLVSTATNETLGKSASDTGVKELYERSQLGGSSRGALFTEVANRHLEQIALRHSLNGQPLVISGMASSAIGWKELPYAAVPFPLDASGLHIEEFEWDCPEGLGPTFIVSGAATDSDMMRGEECQAIGILAEPGLQHFRQRSLLILPGTHSKHILIENGAIRTFQTYMTGELFDTLAKQTILRATVNSTASVKSFPTQFQAGVHYVTENGLAASLFKVRARGVLEKLDGGANAAFLSGLLIGSELSGLERYPNLPILVAGNEHMAELYQLAMQHRAGLHFINSIDRATVTAHRLILANLYR